MAWNHKEWDLFISHAWEDKEEFVRPLALALQGLGVRVWYDELSLELGNSIRRGIEEGLAGSRLGLIVVSRAYLSKEWTKKELDYFFTAEAAGGHSILPIWHDVSLREIRTIAPLLADRLATHSSLGIDRVSEIVANAVKARFKIADRSTLHLPQNDEDFHSRFFRALTLPPVYSQEIARPPKILLADDHRLFCISVTDLLKKGGYTEVEFVLDGTQALRRLEKEEFDLLITDISMPGIDGVSLARKIETWWPNVGIMILSASMEYDEITGAGDQFCLKDVQADTFFEMIRRVVNRHNDDLTTLAEIHGPNRTAYRLLNHARDISIRILTGSYPDNSFEVAFCHKTKHLIRSFLIKIARDSASITAEVIGLIASLRNLYSMLQDIKRSRASLSVILKGIRHDIGVNWPGIVVRVSYNGLVPPGLKGTQIETVLSWAAINFTDNAIEAMGGTGSIEILVRVTQVRKAVVLIVKNSGPKIQLDRPEDVFQDGFSTRGPGRGHGLSILSQLAARHGGKLSLIQTGSVQFSISFPLLE